MPLFSWQESLDSVQSRFCHAEKYFLIKLNHLLYDLLSIWFYMNHTNHKSRRYQKTFLQHFSSTLL